MALNNGTFGTIQHAFKSWMDVECLSLNHAKNFTATAKFTLPLLSSIKGNKATTNTTADRSSINATNATNATLNCRHSNRVNGKLLIARGGCQTEKVNQGDSCAKLAEKCGIPGYDFTKYNSKSGFCASLKPGQHVCCSSGDLPDFRPKPNSDGSCATTKVGDGESCSTIAASNSLTIDDIDKLNKKTWAWNGCENIWARVSSASARDRPPCLPRWPTPSVALKFPTRSLQKI